MFKVTYPSVRMSSLKSGRLSLKANIAAAKLGLLAFRMIERRVRGRQRKANGSRFPAYSDWWPPGGVYVAKRGDSRFGRVTTGGLRTTWPNAEAYEGKGYIWFRSFKLLRQAMGKQTRHLDFDLTGKMWASKKIVIRKLPQKFGGGVGIFLSFEKSYIPGQDWWTQAKHKEKKWVGNRAASPKTKAWLQLTHRKNTSDGRILELSRREERIIAARVRKELRKAVKTNIKTKTLTRVSRS